MKHLSILFYSILIIILMINCTDRASKVEVVKSGSITSKTVVESGKDTVKSARLHEEVFTRGDSITVVLRKNPASPMELLFVVNFKEEKFEGVATLVLIEDDGKYVLPEGTSRLDEKTNQDYLCDSTYNYNSEKISFAFAMENETHDRLSFVINNSSVEGVADKIFTLYRPD